MPGHKHLTTNRTFIVAMFIVAFFIIVYFDKSSFYRNRNFEFIAKNSSIMDIVVWDVNVDLYMNESRMPLNNKADKQGSTTGNKTSEEIVTESSETDDFGNIKYSSKNKRKACCHDCFLHEFEYIIDNPRICSNIRRETAKLFIFVFTEHSNIDKRTAIRKTWLSSSKNNTSEVRYAFVLGETENKHLRDVILKENEIYHDIIKENFKDCYRNLTYKTLLGLKWVTEKCQSVQFVMKTDDDVFVNIKSLMLLLNSSNDLRKNDAIIGACKLIDEPIRDSHSKWYASVYSYPDNSYPGYCSGTGYVMSSSVAKALYYISPNIPFFHLEDVYIALCMKFLGYKVIPTNGFLAYYKANLCEYKHMDVVTVHGISSYYMKEIWNSHC